MNVDPDLMWQRLIARLRSAAAQAAGGQAVITLRVLTVGGTPMIWSRPLVQMLEPTRGDSVIDILSGLCYDMRDEQDV